MYLRVTVTRSESTELYIEVPDDFEVNEIIKHKHQKRIAEIADEITDDSEWDSSEWKGTVDVQSVSVVSDVEAKKYKVGKFVEEPNEKTDPC
jgi:hypothetical protein